MAGVDQDRAICFDEFNWRTFGVKNRSYIVAGVDQDVVSLWQAWQELIKTLSRQSDVLLHVFKWRTFGVKSSSYIVAGVDQDVVSLFQCNSVLFVHPASSHSK